MNEKSRALIRELYTSRYLIWQLAKRDFKSRYAGSMLGLLWAFLQPLAMMLILWFVFTFGLKTQTIEPGISFIPWFFAANVMWLFFQDSLASTSGVIHEYSFLLKKVNFRIHLLPAVKILSAAILHAIFLIILLTILLFSGATPTLYWLQAFYYFFCSAALLLGLGWLTSSLNVFTRDVGQIIAIVIQFGFWMTPIIWNYKTLPEKFQKIAYLNPVFYLTEGYRNSFIYNVSIADHGLDHLAYFWGITLVMIFVGFRIFRKLKPHFGDVI